MYESMLNFPSGLFGEFERLRRELDDVFGASGMPASIRSVAPGTLPAINVGKTPSSVEIDTLLIDGTVQPQTPEGLEAVYAEVRVPHLRRSFTLSRELDGARVDANLKDGVLTLRIPKQADAQPRRMAIQAG